MPSARATSKRPMATSTTVAVVSVRVKEATLPPRIDATPTSARTSSGASSRVLDKMRDYLGHEEPESYRGFVSRWMVVRNSEGATPEQVIHALVAIGDVVAQVAQRAVGHTPEGADFVRATMRMSLVGVRLLAAGLADELEARYARRRELHEEGRR